MVGISIVQQQPSDILIYIDNQRGDNIIIVKRLILTVEYNNNPNDWASYYLRKDEFYLGLEDFEDIQRVIFRSADHVWTAGQFSGVTKAECTGEYMEVRKRVHEVEHF
jgi:hypothetical protein